MRVSWSRPLCDRYVYRGKAAQKWISLDLAKEGPQLGVIFVYMHFEDWDVYREALVE